MKEGGILTIVWIKLVLAMLAIWLVYGPLSTLLLRLLGIGMIKKVPHHKGIALTFDDGPNPQYTVQLLDLLKQYGIRAAFFVVGSKAEQHPEILKRMHAEGHLIGIHHHEHVSNWRLAPWQLKKQLKETDKIIRQVTGEEAKYYRPPYGRFNLFTLLAARKYEVIMWTHILGDWKISNCRKRLLDDLRAVPEDGSIVVLHDCDMNPGADDCAPEYMLQALAIYLEERAKQKTRFTTT